MPSEVANIETINFLKDVIVSIIGVFIGSIITIIYEKRKSKTNELKNNKPVFIVESFYGDKNKSRVIRFYDKSSQESTGEKLFILEPIVITNTTNSVGLLSYIRINEKKYEFFVDEPIKRNETIAIEGFPFGAVEENDINEFYLGVNDINFNKYEFRLFFEIKDSTEENRMFENISFKNQKHVYFKGIDCTSKKIKK